MTARKKVLATSKTELADILNKLDGKRMGLSRKEARIALKHLEILEMACITGGYKSLVAVVRRNAKRKTMKK